MNNPRFSIGIDLGTTHSVLSFIDRHAEVNTTFTFDVPQLTAPGQVESLTQLGSFSYIASEHEMGAGSRVLPWTSSPSDLVGAVARKLGSKTPIRLVASAKSWLCHGGVNRREAILPFQSPEDVQKVSPVYAIQSYLQHLADAWNHQNPTCPIQSQDVTITVPASFDPAARELTAEAAKNIGLESLTLLEEPQAALYNWLESQGDKWREQLTIDDTILVVDIGGGTTDLSLVCVKENNGELSLERIAVGEHILLGGDNMDLALAYTVNQKMSQQGKQLQPWQIQAITQACRDAKEALLTPNDIQSVPITIPSRGSKLLGATLKSELTREDVNAILVEGFFPRTASTEMPINRTRGALTQIGLPYAQDAAITKHIAQFLSRHTRDESGSQFNLPNAVLFNGGVLKSDTLTQRLLSVINSWNEAQSVRSLSDIDLDLAVSKGAAYYNEVKRGEGIRIRGGIASSYYVGIESAMPAIPGMAPPMEALCIAPFGLEEGSHMIVDSQAFGLVIGEPVHFQFYGSTTRKQDIVGQHLSSWLEHELEELPEIEVTLPVSQGRTQGEIVPVKLETYVSEMGTLKLDAIATDNQQKWHVEFDVRDTSSL